MFFFIVLALEGIPRKRRALQLRRACDKYAKMQTEFKDCITKYRDDDWEEQRVGGPDENAKD